MCLGSARKLNRQLDKGSNTCRREPEGEGLIRRPGAGADRRGESRTCRSRDERSVVEPQGSSPTMARVAAGIRGPALHSVSIFRSRQSFAIAAIVEEPSKPFSEPV